MDGRLLTACAFLAIACSAWAEEPPYLAAWPNADRVLADHQGDNPQDTMARQMAALHILRNSIEEMAGSRRWHGLTPDEEELRGRYYARAEEIRDVVNTTLSNELGPGFHGPLAKPPLREWYALQWEYESDPEFRVATLQRYLSPPLLATLGAQVPATAPGAHRFGERRNLLRIVGAGLMAVFALVVVVRTWRRRSARRRAPSSAADERSSPDSGQLLAASASGLRQARYRDAAVEVLDSLEPYIVAAHQQGRMIPIGVFGDPETVGFLQIYARAALAKISNTDEKEVDVDESGEVLRQLLLTQKDRLATYFDGRKEFPERSTSDSVKAEYDKGAVLATLALSMYSITDTSAADQDEIGAAARSSGGLAMQVEPPPTRLHPHGPGAKLAQVLLLNGFSERLVALARES